MNDDTTNTTSDPEAVSPKPRLNPQQNALLSAAIMRRLRKMRRQKCNTKGAFGKSGGQRAKPVVVEIPPKRLDEIG